ncbi:MAG: nickel pincer cofactor biosynthesis protein LarC, partial [Clostridium sp.]|nr:nickel pincer cofactor biosynthesis protein LarC [Clostridium sp.]
HEAETAGGEYVHSHEAAVAGHGHVHSHEAETAGREYVHSHEAAAAGHGHLHSHEAETAGREYVHSHEVDAAGHGHTHGHVHEGGHAHSHAHRNLQDIYQIIDRLDSNDRVKEMARKMFLIVAEAESKAHGLPLDQVHFHEVGAVDSIVDIIGVALCIDNLGIEDVVVSALAEGHGHVRCQHGILPVPVPATANIASSYGLDLRFTDNEGEMVTPTGAAIAAALGTRKQLPSACRLVKIGMGAGNKVFRQANVLRAMILEDSGEDRESMCVLESNLDDCSGESLGFVMELLLEAGAADVWYTPIYMKKNRPAYMLSVICREEDREPLEEIILIHTTTIGIRRYPVTRTILEREGRNVHTAWGDALVKVCTYKGRRFCYPEYESVRALCRSKDVDFQTVYHEVRRAGEEA